MQGWLTIKWSVQCDIQQIWACVLKWRGVCEQYYLYSVSLTVRQWLSVECRDLPKSTSSLRVEKRSSFLGKRSCTSTSIFRGLLSAAGPSDINSRNFACSSSRPFKEVSRTDWRLGSDNMISWLVTMFSLMMSLLPQRRRFNTCGLTSQICRAFQKEAGSPGQAWLQSLDHIEELNGSTIKVIFQYKDQLIKIVFHSTDSIENKDNGTSVQNYGQFHSLRLTSFAEDWKKKRISLLFHSYADPYMLRHRELFWLKFEHWSGPSDAVWRHRSWSKLAQVMTCYLMAPTHYLNQCWLLVKGVLCSAAYRNNETMRYIVSYQGYDNTIRIAIIPVFCLPQIASHSCRDLLGEVSNKMRKWR